MVNNKSLKNDSQQTEFELNEKDKVYGVTVNKPLLLGIIFFIVLSGLFSLVIFQRYSIIKEAKRKASFETLNQAKEKIQLSLAYSASATKTLSFTIDQKGDVHDFDSMSSQIMNVISGIDALQLVPGGVIKYVYPLTGNESVVGYNVLDDSARRREAMKAIEKKEMFYAGPFELKQGGMGIVGRLPVYRSGKFWGFSAVVIRLSTLLKSAGIDSSGSNGYYFQLSKINPDSKQEEFFLPVRKADSESPSSAVEMPNGEWKLSVVKADNYSGFGDIILLSVLGFALSVLGAVSVYRFAIRPQKLNALVKKRTQELKNSEKRYLSVIERISDAFVALDNEWRFTYVNSKAGEMFERDAESLIGKHIWTEFPEGVDNAFYHAYYKAMETQQYQFLEEYFPPYDKWFVNDIYPSADGLTVFFKDVTEVKNISLALKDNEEKYRSLIENASDGIVITNLDGEILEVNDSITRMMGYEEHELIGHHLTEFLPENELEEIPLRINELMQGKSLLYERQLLKKDGSLLQVEINSNMTRAQTLIGFIRDITDRKKVAADLLKTTERFELIAQATNDAIWDHDFVTNRTWGNKNLYDLYAVNNPSEEISFENFLNNIHSDEREMIVSGLKAALAKRQSFITEEFRFKMPDGEYRHFYDRAYIKYDEDGKPLRILGAMLDVTERVRTRKLIEESEEKYRTIVEQASDGIFIASSDFMFLNANKAGCQMLGYTLEELKKLRIVDLVPEEDLESNAEALKTLKAGESLINERRLIKKDGTVIYVEISAKRLPDGSYQSISRDITERKKAEEKLLQSEKKYKLLFNNNPMPMWMATKPGLDIIDVNEAAIKQYGYSREEFLQMNTRNLRPLEDVKNFLQEVEKMQPDKISVRAWKHLRKDGSIIDVESYSHEIVYEGKRAWLTLTNDVTETYEAKKLLQKSFEEIRQLASKLESIREEERTNIAREIHDELGQQLTGLKMDMHWLSRKIASEDEVVNKKIDESIKLINETIKSVRRISTDLRPSILDDLGLLAALEWQADEFEKRSGIKVDFINHAGNISLHPEVATTIFRIYQELLTNIARHANASQVNAELHVDDENLYFNLSDNGVGFDTYTIRNKRTLGLLGIKERTLLLGGNYEIKSKPGSGSHTSISIPLSIINEANLKS